MYKDISTRASRTVVKVPKTQALAQTEQKVSFLLCVPSENVPLGPNLVLMFWRGMEPKIRQLSFLHTTPCFLLRPEHSHYRYALSGYGNNIKGVIVFLLWCTFMMPSFKNTALIFPEISFTQYFTIFSCTQYDVITDLICIIEKRRYL